MSIPSAAVPVPRRVAALARGARLEPVWQNALGGLTFRAVEQRSGAERYIKWGPRHEETSMVAEAERLRWAGSFVAVPRVIAQGEDDDHEWLVTEGMPGKSAVAPQWIARPETAVAAVGRGLRALHDALPAADCPYDWGVAARLKNAADRGIHVPDQLSSPPEADALVVCHGDACCPNTLLAGDGAVVGHVDLGALGVADRWADIAVASMSTEWNYGSGWEDALVEAYGVEPDRDRLAYYRDLWNAT